MSEESPPFLCRLLGTKTGARGLSAALAGFPTQSSHRIPHGSGPWNGIQDGQSNRVLAIMPALTTAGQDLDFETCLGCTAHL